ncbi:hypothetical protein, partial [Agrobacterium tumefaciens]|uniref:hypothetical protein n=1 Tax=Agrobacterium tumefaciens TaxID=358 RepID=UPI001CBBC0BE
TQRDRQQSADFAHERLIGTTVALSLNPGKFQLPLAQIRGAPHNPGKFQLPLAQIRGAPHNPGKFQLPLAQIRGAPHKTAGANSKLDKTWGQGQA